MFDLMERIQDNDILAPIVGVLLLTLIIMVPLTVAYLSQIVFGE